VQGALQWLEDNQDKSIEDIKAPAPEAKDHDDDPNELPPNLLEGEVAKSLVCNECGKKFRSHAQAEFHASKTLDSILNS
jgi:UBX domain-containing protein 1/4